MAIAEERSGNSSIFRLLKHMYWKKKINKAIKQKPPAAIEQGKFIGSSRIVPSDSCIIADEFIMIILQ
jgi:hypothetical protein